MSVIFSIAIKPESALGLASSQTRLYQAVSQPEEDTLPTENQAGGRL